MIEKNQQKRIAIVVLGYEVSGGIFTLTNFIYNFINSHPQYTVDIFSLATTSHDTNSIRLLSPKTWFKPIKLTPSEHRGTPYTQVGARFVEFELQRYKPRAELTERLNTYDLIQVIAGSPPCLSAVKNVQKPICLYIATMTKPDRLSRINEASLLRRIKMKLFLGHLEKLDKVGLSRSDHVFALSPYTLRLIQELVHEDLSTTILAPGINTDIFIPKRDYNSEGYILSVSRLHDPRKNIRLLISAYKIMCDTLENPPDLVLVGGKLPPSNIELIKELGLTEKITNHQFVSNEKLPPLYQNASMFVLSSDEEGLGIVLMEAMACGLPVLSTRSGGPEDLIVENQNGLLSEVGNITDFSKKLITLYNQPEDRKRFGIANIELINQEYSLSAAGQKVQQVYEKLLSTGSDLE